MSEKLRPPVANLLEYLSQKSERNEHLALGYFDNLFKGRFKRQSDACGADGYVPGHLVLELKGKPDDWYQAFFQALAYQNKDLAFSVVVVACSEFLAFWHVDDIPVEIRQDVLEQFGKAPNVIGKQLAAKYKNQKNKVLNLATWYHAELTTPVFKSNLPAVAALIDNFETCLKQGKKVRQPITIKNFLDKLGIMKEFFDPAQPIKTVRAFYAMIHEPWNELSTVALNQRIATKATFMGTEITDLIPSKRAEFKAFVEDHILAPEAQLNTDPFFEYFDRAIDRVDSQFRIKHGIYFTDLDLSRFAMWFVKQRLPNLGKNYLVIDPACGSGNLVTNWRSPLELRHKVVSEIEPELLYAVEKRMKADTWHNNKFTVVPKTETQEGLNFLDRSAKEYLDILKIALEEKKQKPDKPIAFLCNPPYRNDDDKAAEGVKYSIHPSILRLVGNEGLNQRYTGFLAQMKLICDEAKDSGFPEKSILMLFTKSTWLTQREDFQQIRREMRAAFNFEKGFLVNSKEFFNVKSEFPVAFTIWSYEGKHATLNTESAVRLTDLAWLKKKDLDCIDWDNFEAVDDACARIVTDERAIDVAFGLGRQSLKEWCGQPQLDFKRQRRKTETDRTTAGGLPKNDPRRNNQKSYGESTGTVIGFMDNLTPCRNIKGELGDFPWFTLHSTFQQVRACQMTSGPFNERSYKAKTLAEGTPFFLWFGIARTFATCGYPLWLDNSSIWPPTATGSKLNKTLQYCLAISYADNQCLSVVFPAGNPVPEAPETKIGNPMSPLVKGSFWNREMRPLFNTLPPDSVLVRLVQSTDEVFKSWHRELKGKVEINIAYQRPYLIDSQKLMFDAGLLQIKHYAEETGNQTLIEKFQLMANLLKECKKEFKAFLTDEAGLNYFGEIAQDTTMAPQTFVVKSKFDKIIERRIALAALLVYHLHADKNFGRTKLEKLFYLADVDRKLNLETQYTRAAAGPLDPRCLYNPDIGIESVGMRYGYFEPETQDKFVRYKPGKNLEGLVKRAEELYADQLPEIRRLIKLMAPMNTAQAEIVATLYACWKDMILENKVVSDKLVIDELLRHWHPQKKQFSRERLQKALDWMRSNKIVPITGGKRTILPADS